MKNLECKVDALDLKILSIISKDARIPFRNVAELCGVSRAAIHLRVQHLVDMGIISGSNSDYSRINQLYFLLSAILIIPTY